MSLAVAPLLAVGCNSADSQERKQINLQQVTYAKNQPVPQFDWSLSRHIWVQFYDSQNREVTTFSYITGVTGGPPLFEAPAVGYALPRDTQLTNPKQVLSVGDKKTAEIDQSEPNGLFTSQNTDGTVIFVLNKNGTVSPVYTELKVTAFPFPVKWQSDEHHPNGHWVRVGEPSSSGELKTKR